MFYAMQTQIDQGEAASMLLGLTCFDDAGTVNAEGQIAKGENTIINKIKRETFYATKYTLIIAYTS